MGGESCQQVRVAHRARSPWWCSRCGCDGRVLCVSVLRGAFPLALSGAAAFVRLSLWGCCGELGAAGTKHLHVPSRMLSPDGTKVFKGKIPLHGKMRRFPW